MDFPTLYVALADGWVILTTGAFLSILRPPIGPALMQFPALSQTFLLLVDTFSPSSPSPILSSVPAVDNKKSALVGFRRPDILSLALQAMLTSFLCQKSPASSQSTLGAFLSMPTVKEAFVSALPAASLAK